MTERFPLSLPPDLDRRKLAGMIFGIIVAIRIDEFSRALGETGSDAFDALRLEAAWNRALLGIIPDDAQRSSRIALTRLLARHHGTMSEAARSRTVSGLAAMFEDPQVKEFLKVHEHEGTLYYSKEEFDEFVEFLGFIALVRSHDGDSLTRTKEIAIFKNVKEIITRLRNLSNSSEYKFRGFVAKLQKSVSPSTSTVL
jgi:hypothetical protein